MRSDGFGQHDAAQRRQVVIVGGGLAGLAAAVALAEKGLPVELFEARRRLGGRATSFYDSAGGEWIDHCQHVGMGCCTNLADFCQRTSLAGLLRRDKLLHFIGPDGICVPFSASRWLPAPLHLAPAFLRLRFLTLGERLAIGHALWRLARTTPDDTTTIGEWLRDQRQSPRSIELFWSVVLVSALGEQLDRASLAHARKVFVDGFLVARTAYQIDVPRVSLDELYGDRLQTWLTERGVKLHLGADVRRILGDGHGVYGIELADGTRREAAAVIAAVTWRRVRELFDAALLGHLPELSRIDEIDAAPITGVHLWFDRQITALPHAVLVGRLSQWLFNRGTSEGVDTDKAHYYQVVISASRSLSGRDREAIVAEIVGELATIWPLVRQAKLLRWRMVTEQNAVFSVRPGIDRLRPAQRSSLPQLAFAGDWTQTGWPSTMEGAVRSGYLAAEAVLEALGRPERILALDLKPARLYRLVFGLP